MYLEVPFWVQCWPSHRADKDVWPEGRKNNLNYEKGEAAHKQYFVTVYEHRVSCTMITNTSWIQSWMVELYYMLSHTKQEIEDFREMTWNVQQVRTNIITNTQ